MLALTTMGFPGRFMLYMLLELGSFSLRTVTARLYRAQLALFKSRFEPTTV
jgi:hypothetical protein